MAEKYVVSITDMEIQKDEKAIPSYGLFVYDRDEDINKVVGHTPLWLSGKVEDLEGSMTDIKEFIQGVYENKNQTIVIRSIDVRWID